MLSISNDRFYHALRNEAPSTHIEKIHPPRLLLTDEEELEIINQIEKRQMQNDCLSSKNIRDLVEEIYKFRTGAIKAVNRPWFFRV